MPYTLFEIAINLYEGILMIYFVRACLDSDRRSPLWIDTLFVLAIAAAFTMYSFVDISIPDTWIFIIPLLYSFATHRGTLPGKLLCTLILGLLFVGLVGLIPKLYVSLLHIDWDAVIQSTPQRIGCVISYNLVLTIVLFVLPRSIRHDNKLIPRFFALFVCLILLIQLVTVESLFTMQERTDSDGLLITIYVCLLLGSVATLCFYEAISRYMLRKHSQLLLAADEEKTSRHSTEMTAYYQRMLVLQHDLHNQINQASMLAESADFEGYQRCLKELSHLIDDKNPFLTGNISVDAIITGKLMMAKQHGISFNFEPYPLTRLPIDAVDFCTLLSNILDNALEGALRVDPNKRKDAFVSLRLLWSWDMFYMECANSCNPQTIRKRGNDFISSKQEGNLHGLGTQSIRQTVSAHDGTYSFAVEGDIFTVSIVLPAEGDA